MINHWDLDPREQVLDECREEWQVLCQELGDVGISHSSNQNHIFVEIWVSPFKGTCHYKDRLYSSHAKVVMILLRKLFRGQFVKLDHLG